MHGIIQFLSALLDVVGTVVAVTIAWGWIARRKERR